MRYLSFRSKFILSSVLISSVVLISAAGLIFTLHYQRLRQSTREDLAAVAQILCVQLVAPLQSGEVLQAERFLEMLHSNPSILHAHLYDEHQEPFASYWRHGELEPVPALPITLLGQGPVYTGDSIRILHPVKHAEQVIGFLYVVRSIASLQSMLATDLVVVIAAKLVGISLALLLAGYMARRVTRPIHEITRAAQQLARDRNYASRVPVTGQDEVGQLGEAFNTMAATLQQRELDLGIIDQQLRKLNATLEARVSERTEALKQSNEQLQQFAYVVSHDLREPLRTMASFAALLARRYRDQLDQNGRDFIDFITAGADRSQRLIADVLKLSRIGTHGSNFVEVNSTQLLQDLLQDLSLAITESQAIITVGQLPTVVADPGQLGQVFHNLISNAIKFHRPGIAPRIEVEGHADAAFWYFSVSDNGLGIEPKNSERIFALFQQVDGRSSSGTGIGLTICSRIVQRHGGRIWVESQPGQGSRFCFTLAKQLPEL